MYIQYILLPLCICRLLEISTQKLCSWVQAGQTDVEGGLATRGAPHPRPPGSRKVVGTAQSTLIRPVRQKLQKSKVVPHNRFKKTNTASFCRRGQGGVAVSSQIWFWAFLRSKRKEKKTSVGSQAQHGKTWKKGGLFPQRRAG